MLEKDFVGIVTIDLTCLLPTNHIITYIILQWYTGVREETFEVNSKKVQGIQNIYCRKVESTLEMANFGNYPRDFILKSGDQETWSKIWSLPDYPGELTALPVLPYKRRQNLPTTSTFVF